MMRRLLSGMGANLYGQAVTVLAQICAFPLLLHAWGPKVLGTWLTLVAWTSLLSLADGGFMVAAGTAAILAAGRGDLEQAGVLLRRLLRLVSRVAGFFGAAVVMAAVIEAGWQAAPSVDHAAAAALGLAALAGLPLGSADLGLRAVGRYAQGMVLTSTVRLFETVGVMAVAAGGGALSAAATVLLLARSIGAVGAWHWLRRQAPALWSADLSGRPDLLRSLRGPALAALAFPAALALSLQGTTIASSLVAPAEAVAGFVAARTLTRFIVQAIGLVTHAIMPEYGLAVGRGDRRRQGELLRLNLLASVVLLVPGWAVLVLVGPAVLARWTGPAFRPDPVGFDLLASAALAHGVWLSAANLLLAVNRQGEVARRALVVAAATALSAALLGAASGLHGVALAGLVGELVMVVLVLPPQVAAAIRPAVASRPARV